MNYQEGILVEINDDFVMAHKDVKMIEKMKTIKLYSFFRLLAGSSLIAVTISDYSVILLINAVMYNLNTLNLYYGATRYSEGGFVFFIATLIITFILDMGFALRINDDQKTIDDNVDKGDVITLQVFYYMYILFIYAYIFICYRKLSSRSTEECNNLRIISNRKEFTKCCGLI